jgi:flagellar basal body-associated protein FliL
MSAWRKDAARNHAHPPGMSIRTWLTVAGAAVALTAVPASAANPPPGKEEKSKEIGQYIDLQPVGLPIVANRKLVNYIFVYVRINLTSQANTARLREKEPYFRDALVRSAHRTPFTDPKDYNRIDSQRLIDTMYTESVKITGPGQVKSVIITSWSPRWKIATPKS